MARPVPFRRARGFSLVEMLVALLFTGLLMSGMAQVFKTSLGAFTTSGEILSAARRNRMSIDLLYDDLNTAGMYLTDLTSPPALGSANPAFYILPNEVVAGIGADGPATADQLLFYFDQPLPFEGVLGDTSGIKTGADFVTTGADPIDAGSYRYVIDCGTTAYANLVKPGMSLVFKDYWESRFIGTAVAGGTRFVTVDTVMESYAPVKGVGSGGGPAKVKHIPGSGVLFFTPAQMVRYSIKVKNLDPQQPAGIPCLVRDQGNYSSAGFVADPALEAVITENVSGLKVYLSADFGQSWAGYGQSYSGIGNGWTSGIRADLNTQLASSGRQDYTTTAGDENWFRQIPVLVRLDISTRTAVKRSEYSSNPTTAAFKDVTQSLVIVPRHFGLAMK